MACFASCQATTVPHIGEDAVKTNAVRDVSAGVNPRPAYRRPRPICGRPALLIVGFQHPVAGRTDVGTMFLQARQNGEIALIDDRAALALHVTRTGSLFRRRAASHLLSQGGRGEDKRRQGKSQDKFTHRVPYVLTADEFRPVRGFAGKVLEIAGDAAGARPAPIAQAPANAAKFETACYTQSPVGGETASLAHASF
jgi:hypothetical protein